MGMLYEVAHVIDARLVLIRVSRLTSLTSFPIRSLPVGASRPPNARCRSGRCDTARLRPKLAKSYILAPAARGYCKSVSITLVIHSKTNPLISPEVIVRVFRIGNGSQRFLERPHLAAGAVAFPSGF